MIVNKQLQNLIFGLLWLTAVSSGLFYLLKYEYKSGTKANTPLSWPKQDLISISKTKPTLVMLLHPKCSCSKASLEELSKLIAIFPDKFETKLIFFYPKDNDPEWAKDSLWQTASRIPYIELLADKEGSIAKAFGATTSGHVALYGTDRKLLFNGGITPSRAHIGDNAGKKAIIEILKSGATTRKEALTFGCSIFNTQKGK